LSALRFRRIALDVLAQAVEKTIRSPGLRTASGFNSSAIAETYAAAACACEQ